MMIYKKPLFLSETVFYLCFFILLGYRSIGGVDGPTYYTPMILLACSLFVLKAVMTRHTVAELVCIVLLYLCAGITYIYTGEKGLLIDYAMMLGMKGISEKRLFRLGAWFLGPAMFLVILPYAVGVLEDQASLHMAGRRPWMIYRYCLGYPHTNTLLTTYIILMMLIMFFAGYEDRRKTLIRSGLMALGAVYLWLWCDSSTGAVITGLYLLMNLYFGYCARFGRVDRIIIYGLYPLVNIASIGGTLLYMEKILDSLIILIGRFPMLRYILSFVERFKLSHYYLEKYSLSLFGTRIVIPENYRYGIDVSQMFLLVGLGLIAFVTVSVLYYILLVDCVHNKRRSALPIILCLMIMGITDPLLYNLSCKNLTFFFMGAALYRWFAERKRVNPSSIFHREILLLPVGERELPRLTATVARFDSWVKQTFVFDRKRLLISLVLAVVIAVIYHLFTVAKVEPILDNALAGMYLHALYVLSAGIYAFLIGYGSMCILGARANRS